MESRKMVARWDGYDKECGSRDEKIVKLQLSLSDKIGPQFFEAAAIGLNKLLNADVTIIGLIANEKTEVSTLAMTNREGLLPNIQFSLVGTPAETLNDTRVCIFKENVKSLFPHDALLRNFDIEGYICFAVTDASKNLIGIVAGLFRDKISDAELADLVFELFRPRIQAEIERMKMEQKIRDQQERYEFALHSGGFGVYDWNTFTSEMVFDEKFYEVIGYTPSQLKPSYENWVSIVHPEDYKNLAVKIERRIGNGKEYYGPVKLRIRTFSGNYKWVQIESYSFYYDTTKNAKRNIGIIKDIDKQIQNEEHLLEAERQQRHLNEQVREREQRYAFALKVGKLGVYDWFVKENRTVCSPILAELMGCKLEEFNTSYDAWLASIHPEDRERFSWKEHMPALVVSNSPNLYRMKVKSGDYRWMESHNLGVEFDDQGDIVRMIGIVKDIDDQKRSADMLSASLEKQKQLNLELRNREQALTESQGQLISQMTVLQKLNKELRESETRWAYALEGNGDGVIEWDMVKDELFFSKRAKAILGFALNNREEQRRFLEHVHPDSREEFKHNFLLCIAPPYDPFQMEVQIIDDEQALRWIMFRGKVVEMDESNMPLKMVGTVTDLAEHKLFQKELTIYEEMIKQNQSIILFTTLDGTIEFINTHAIAMLEYRQHQIIGQNIGMLLPEISAKDILTEGFRSTLNFHTRSGREIVTQVSTSLIRNDGHAIGFVFNGIDVTEKTLLEAKITSLTLAKLEAELDAQRKQTEMTIEVQEYEKQSIARELHDGIGQLLSLAKLNVEELEYTLQPDRRKDCRILKDILQHIGTDLKGLTQNLMPLSIRNLGIESALTGLLERYHQLKEKDVDILCKIHLDGYEPDQKAAIHIYRIAQEAINNSIKYSGASAMSLLFMKLKNTLNLIIEDNGMGFNYNEQVTKQNSFGLKTMKERARLINGKLVINSTPNTGTAISLIIPLTS